MCQMIYPNIKKAKGFKSKLIKATVILGKKKLLKQGIEVKSNKKNFNYLACIPLASYL